MNRSEMVQPQSPEFTPYCFDQTSAELSGVGDFVGKGLRRSQVWVCVILLTLMALLFLNESVCEVVGPGAGEKSPREEMDSDRGLSHDFGGLWGVRDWNRVVVACIWEKAGMNRRQKVGAERRRGVMLFEILVNRDGEIASKGLRRGMMATLL